MKHDLRTLFDSTEFLTECWKSLVRQAFEYYEKGDSAKGQRAIAAADCVALRLKQKQDQDQ